VEEKQLLTLREVARHLRVTTSWLKREVDAGRIPHLRAGARRLFSLGAVEKILVERAASAEGKRQT
jgi:excisionase family DNA binding protein